MARVLWLGDAGCHTGFGRVTHAIGERLVRDYGHDIDNTDNAYQTGLGFAVSLDKFGGFIGRDEAAKQKAMAGDRANVRGMIQGAMTSAQNLMHQASGLNNLVGYASQAKGWWNKQVDSANSIMKKQGASQVTGARGTFSGETAGRMSATYSISVQQLQETKRQSDFLQQIVDGVKGGALVG